ncbi:MAG TPA: hypothetical protein VFJ85_16325 [Acidimicrobiales bacterium]|nr:hypothetical protein [Acidimicrobiales bacterium]
MALPLLTLRTAAGGAPPETSTSNRPARLVLVAAGVVPVSLIALSTFGYGLRGMALHLALPALALVALVAAVDPDAGAIVRRGVRSGIAATALYDVSRFGFLWAGVVHRDPIPHIGTALGLAPAALFGYLWRYLGNGAGLALTFRALGLRGEAAGVAYGLAVCAGLFVVLAVSPFGQEALFPLNTGTVVMATTGHAIFGAVLGRLSRVPD